VRDFDDEDIDRQLAELEEMPSADREDLQRSPHLGYVILFTEDVEEVSEFYETLFQFQRNYETSNTVELQAGSTILSITDSSYLVDEVGLSNVPSPGPGRVGLTLLVEDVDATYEAALALGAESIRAPRDTEWGMRSAWVRDPAGHLIEIGRWVRR